MDYRKKEGIIHHILFGELEATFGHMEREYQAKKGWGRVDFRYGTPNPRVIELVVRDPQHRNQHYGTQNWSELNKLCRVPYSKARVRILLVLDTSGDLNPVSKRTLRRSYDHVHPSRGRFEKYPVSVIYVHPKRQYRFMWPR